MGQQRKKLSKRLYLSETKLRSHRHRLEGAKRERLDRVLEEMRLLRKEITPQKHFGEPGQVPDEGSGSEGESESESQVEAVSVRGRSPMSPDLSD